MEQICRDLGQIAQQMQGRMAETGTQLKEMQQGSKRTQSVAPAGPKIEAGATKTGEGVEARAAAEQEQQGREGHNSSKRAKAKKDMGGPW